MPANKYPILGYAYSAACILGGLSFYLFTLIMKELFGVTTSVDLPSACWSLGAPIFIGGPICAVRLAHIATDDIVKHIVVSVKR